MLDREAERRVRGLDSLVTRRQVLPDDEVELAYLRFHDVYDNPPEGPLAPAGRPETLRLPLSPRSYCEGPGADNGI